MKTYKNLYQKLCSAENIDLAFKKAQKRKSRKPYVIEFKNNLNENLRKLLEGWMSYANHANTYNLRQKIVNVVETNFPGNTSLLQIDRLIKQCPT